MRTTRGFSHQSGRILFLLAVVGVAGWWLVHPRPSDRELIAELVTKAERAFESRSVGGIMSCIASDYEDSSGLARADVYRFAQRLAREVQKVEVTINDQRIEMAGRKATGHFDAQVTFTQAGEVIRWQMQLEVQFEKQRQGFRGLLGGAWVVKSVSGHGLDKSWEDLI